MKHIKYGEPLNILVVAKGHPFERDAFAAIFEEMDGIAASFMDQPAAMHMIRLETVKAFDVLVFYDMPGLDFRAPRPERPRPVDPSPGFKQGFQQILTEGKGVVALHHAIAGWPSWPDYAEWLGGRFLYRRGPLRGTERTDSGYRHNVTYDAVVADKTHPVVADLPERMSFTDEVYLYEVFDESVTPLLRADHAFTQDNFYSAELAVAQGKMFSNEGWQHAPGPNLVGWTKRAINSPLVYLQPGDGLETYNNANYRKLLNNAIRWAASPAALDWARQK